jgi:hypothetical protein
MPGQLGFPKLLFVQPTISTTIERGFGENCFAFGGSSRQVIPCSREKHTRSQP